MAVSYKKLFHMLIDRDISAAQLQKQAGYSANISTRRRNNSYVSGVYGEDMPGAWLQG